MVCPTYYGVFFAKLDSPSLNFGRGVFNPKLNLFDAFFLDDLFRIGGDSDGEDIGVTD